MSASLDRTELVEKAAAHLQRGELDKALPHYVTLFKRDPQDWNIANTLGDLYVRLGKADEAVEHFSALAERLAADGFTAKARALYRKILRIQPKNALARHRVEELDKQGTEASPFLQRVLQTARSARTSVPDAAPEVTPPPAPAVPATVSEPLPAPIPVPIAAPEETSVWQPAAPQAAPADEWEALALTEPAANPPSAAPVRHTEQATHPTAAVAREPVPVPADPFRDMEIAAQAALARQDFAAAASAIQRFLVAHPRHIGALEQLIDVGVDGRLEATLLDAQVQLAEACLDEGQYERARDIAVDLIFREPGDARFQALLDRVTTVSRARGRAVHVVAPEMPTNEASAVVEVAAAPPVLDELPAIADSMAGAHLSASRHDVHPDLREWSDPEQAFDDLRTTWLEEAAAAAEERFSSAAAFIDAKQYEQAARALDEAMCAPHLRAPAGARLACLYRDLGDPMEALACLEWVAEVPPASQDHGHDLAYELAVTLEALGQGDQALGIYRELLAEVGPSYRDIAARTERIAAA